MNRLRMTKATLSQRRQQLAMYERVLPSLELKRQQLLRDLRIAREQHAALESAQRALEQRAQALAPAADPQVTLEGLQTLHAVSRSQESRLGVRLPVVDAFDWHRADYDLAATPPWLDHALDLAARLAEGMVRLQVAAERVCLLDQALRKTVQRINLLDQVLKPQAKRDIGRIGVFLADADRTALARTKLAGARRHAADALS
ncbi:MAG: V-type ATP synthase subunit D [Sphingomonadales bacterium]|nr:MAG: V-type ATP synthase subunit D [Sphingomonadales bacterium]